MQCKQADSLIDAYMDGEMVGELRNALRHHAESCADCRARIGEERVLRARLAALPIEGPADGFFEQALNAAKVAQPDELTGASAKPRRRWAIRSGGALAAGFTLWFAAGYLLHAPVITSSPALPEVAISMSQTTPVNLVFTSTGDLRGARVSLKLPAGRWKPWSSSKRAVRARRSRPAGPGSSVLVRSWPRCHGCRWSWPTW